MEGIISEFRESDKSLKHEYIYYSDKKEISLAVVTCVVWILSIVVAHFLCHQKNWRDVIKLRDISSFFVICE